MKYFKRCEASQRVIAQINFKLLTFLVYLIMETIVIRTRPTIEESLHLLKSDYEALRNRIVDKLLTIFDNVEFADADCRHYELLCNCVKYHGKAARVCMSTFNIEEWVAFSAEEFNTEIQKKLDWAVNVVKVLDPSTVWNFPSFNRKK